MPTGKIVKWDVKPTFLKEMMDDAIIRNVVDWVIRNINMHEIPIVRNTLIIYQHVNCDQTRVPKILLECYVR